MHKIFTSKSEHCLNWPLHFIVFSPTLSGTIITTGGCPRDIVLIINADGTDPMIDTVVDLLHDAASLGIQAKASTLGPCVPVAHLLLPS